jgi:ArsR family transcriptional regulator
MSDWSLCSHCFKSLGIESRVKIYTFLREKGKSTVNDIVNVLDLTQPTVSYHLKEMKDAGLLTSDKQGKSVFYSVNCHCPETKKSCFLSMVDLEVR